MHSFHMLFTFYQKPVKLCMAPLSFISTLFFMLAYLLRWCLKTIGNLTNPCSLKNILEWLFP